ncbi:MAG: DUF3822 family protein [Bacteroidales bacterium]|nr:DUF3822 family protein [Bacteroidales bacterium]
MQDFSYFHESFNLRKLSSYFLQIQLCKLGVGYVITDTIRNQHIAIKHKAFENPDENILTNFQNAVKEDVYLNKHYKTVNFLFISEKNSLIPADYFDKKHLKEYFKFNFILSEQEEVHFNYIEKAKAYNIYSIPSTLINFLVNHFPEIRLYHYTTPLIKSTFNDVGANNAFDTIRISIQNQLMNIVIVKNQKLIFFNDFDFHTEEDAVFYIMSVMKKLLVNLRRADVTIQGTIEKNGKLHKYLLKYIPEIKFHTKFDKEFPFSQIPNHIFANLLDFEA